MIKYNRDKSGKIHEIEGDLFVTKDQHGQDVCAGDRIEMFSKQYKVVWDSRELGWYLQDEYKAKIKLSHTNINHIELIKEKDHD